AAGADLQRRLPGHGRRDGRTSRRPRLPLCDHAAPGGRAHPRSGQAARRPGPRRRDEPAHRAGMTTTPDPEEAQAAIEYCYAQGWSDGLPLVPASQPLIDEFLATTSRDPDDVIGELEQVGRSCTVYLAAVN